MILELVGISFDAFRVDVLLFHPFASFVFVHIMTAVPIVLYHAVLTFHMCMSIEKLDAVDAVQSLLGTNIVLQFVIQNIPVQISLINQVDFTFRTFRKILHDVRIIFAVPIEYARLALNVGATFEDHVTTAVYKLPLLIRKRIALFVLLEDDAVRAETVR